MPADLPALATPAEVADYLRTTTAAVAQGPLEGLWSEVHQARESGVTDSRVLYRSSDVLEWLDRNTIQSTDEARMS
jgi:hypothetical protein